jgi:nicotinate dehydrogenase subunit B
MNRPSTPFDIFAVPAGDFHLIRPDEIHALGGLFVVLTVKNQPPVDEGLNHESGELRAWDGRVGRENGAWIHIGQDSKVTAFTGKVEVGQDVRTVLAQVVAEELRVPLDRVRLVMGDTDLTPFDMGTFGSRTTPFTVPHFRSVAAAARELMLDLAVQLSGSDRSTLTANQGQVIHSATKRTFSYGELASQQTLAKRLTSDATVRSPQEWEVMGQSIAKASAREMATGSHHFTSDLTRPQMMWGKMLRPPTFGATLEWVDESVAVALPGVIFVRESDFVGVAAPHPALAERALAALKARWTIPVHTVGSETYDYKNNIDSVQGDRNSEPMIQGSISAGLAAADHVLETSYRIAYIAHAPLEPRAALAQWQGEGDDQQLTVWTGTQRPFGVRDELAEAFGISTDRVRVVVPDTGSGYGGKHTGEAAIEAARLARLAERPVKLVWTREEEFTWAYNRPGGIIEVKAGFRGDGTLTGWEFHNINSGSAGLRTPYRVANQFLEFHPIDAPLRQGSYRALASTANHFARESLMDEIAHQLDIDPLQLRLRNLGDERMRTVLETAVRHFGWEVPCPIGRGFGLAVGTEKAGYVATCAEVSVEGGHLKVERLTTAFECGAILNPDNLRNQIEGALVQGLGGALFEAVQWDEGRILSDCFSRYRVPRFSDMPKLETILVERKDLPSEGAGESPLIAVAPAIGNALFAATGLRQRSMPLGTKF